MAYQGTSNNRQGIRLHNVPMSATTVTLIFRFRAAATYYLMMTPLILFRYQMTLMPMPPARAEDAA